MAPERRWRRHLVWAAVVLAYACVFPYFGALNNPNENVRVFAARALAHHGTLAIDEVEEEWGTVGDRAVAGGRHYSSKAPGTLLLGVPVHFVHDRLARLFTGYSPSPRATTLVLRLFAAVPPLALFLWIFARRVEAETGSPHARDLLTLGLGLGTMFYPYGLTFVGHAQSAALLFAAFLALTPGAGTPSPRRLVLAGALAGLGVVFEYQTVVAAAALAIYAVVRLGWRRVWPFAAGALGPALLLGAYHTILFGRPWTLPYAHLADEGYRLFHHAQGFLGVGRPRLGALKAATLNVDYGLFVFSPFLAVGLLVSLAGFVRGSGPARAIHGLVLAVTAGMLIFLSAVANWRAGWCAGGPRYVAAVVPFLAYAVALGWRPLLAGRRWAQAALAALVLVSVFLCVLAGAVFPHFPLQFDNPIFDLVIPLLREGFAPHSLGTLLGLRGVASLIPLALVVALAVVVALASPRAGRLGSSAVAVAVALALVAGLSRHGTRFRRDEERARAYVREIWEPRREPPPPAAKSEGEHRGPA